MIPGLNFGNTDAGTAAMTQFAMAKLQNEQAKAQNLTSTFQTAAQQLMDQQQFKDELALRKELEEKQLGEQSADRLLREKLGIGALDQEGQRIDLLNTQFDKRFGEEQRQFNITSGMTAGQNMMENLFRGQDLALRDKLGTRGLDQDATRDANTFSLGQGQLNLGRDQFNYGKTNDIENRTFLGQQNQLDRDSQQSIASLNQQDNFAKINDANKQEIYGAAQAVASGEAKLTDVPPEYQHTVALIAAKGMLDTALNKYTNNMQNGTLSVGEMQDVVNLLSQNMDTINQLPERERKEYTDLLDMFNATLPTDYPLINQADNTMRGILPFMPRRTISTPEYYGERLRALSDKYGAQSNQQVNMPRVK